MRIARIQKRVRKLGRPWLNNAASARHLVKAGGDPANLTDKQLARVLVSFISSDALERGKIELPSP